MSQAAPLQPDSGLGDLESLRRLALHSVVLAIVVALLSSPAYLAAFGWDVEAAIFGVQASA